MLAFFFSERVHGDLYASDLWVLGSFGRDLFRRVTCSSTAANRRKPAHGGGAVCVDDRPRLDECGLEKVDVRLPCSSSTRVRIGGTAGHRVVLAMYRVSTAGPSLATTRGEPEAPDSRVALTPKALKSRPEHHDHPAVLKAGKSRPNKGHESLISRGILVDPKPQIHLAAAKLRYLKYHQM